MAADGRSHSQSSDEHRGADSAMNSSASSSFSSSSSATPSSVSSPPLAVAGAVSGNTNSTIPAAVVDGVANLIHSSDSGPAPAGHPPAQSEGGGDGEVYDATLWAKILDDDTHMELEGEDAEQKPPYVASVGDTAAAALHFGSNQARGGLGSAFASLHREGYPASLGDDMKTEPGATPIFDHWGHYDPEMAGAMADFSPTIHAPPPSSSVSAASTPSGTSSLLYLPSTNLQSAYEEYQPTIESSFMGSAGMSSLVSSQHPTFSAFSNRTHILSFEPQPDGTPFPLSKPIIREDGILLVGTEIVPDHSSTKAQVKNRIFVTNFLRSNQSSQAPSHILVEEEVRDMHWMDARTAIVAVGKEIQLIQVGDSTGGGPCRLQDPINSVHSDTIRELAVSPTTSSYVLSGGFDETVVLTDLRNQGDPKASAIIGKFDAYDVVSSVRWSPTESQLSWTTDGGDFQVADIRVRSAQLQVPLSTFLHVDSMGGLFAHEYLSSFTIALGFERGHLAFVDTRMPRETSCYSMTQSPLAATGEIRRSKSNKFAVFGLGGFSTAELNAQANDLQQITLRQEQHQMARSSYKTSGDFSFEKGAYLAVADNLGIVSVYTDDTPFAPSATFSGSGDTWSL